MQIQIPKTGVINRFASLDFIKALYPFLVDCWAPKTAFKDLCYLQTTLKWENYLNQYFLKNFLTKLFHKMLNLKY